MQEKSANKKHKYVFMVLRVEDLHFLEYLKLQKILYEEKFYDEVKKIMKKEGVNFARNKNT